MKVSGSLVVSPATFSTATSMQFLGPLIVPLVGRTDFRVLFDHPPFAIYCSKSAQALCLSERNSVDYVSDEDRA
jgi:hypothetical protein